MAWGKFGDNAATYPPLMKVAYLGDDDRYLNEVAGFVFRCALQAAGHTTDYIIDFGTAQMIGGPNYRNCIDLAERAGLFEPWELDGAPAWKLIEDPQFIHLRLKSEIEWDRQQANDSKNTKLTSAVRHRDGDTCRYCSNIVYFGARSGARRGTYDHRVPGEPGTVETLVVACGQCNSGRKDYEDSEARYPLLPPPPKPYYSESTAAWLAKYGYDVQTSEPPRPGQPKPQAQQTPQRQQHPAETPDALGTATEAPTGRPSSPTAPHGAEDRSPATDAHADPERPAQDVLPEAPADMPKKSGLSGTGRGGAGRAGKGREASSQAGHPSSRNKPKRSRRGRPRTRGGK